MSRSSDEKATANGPISLATPLYPAAPATPGGKGATKFLTPRRALVGLVGVLILLIGAGFAANQITASNAAAIAKVNVGDCFDAPTSITNSSQPATSIEGIQTIPCTQAHDSQVYTKVKILESAFPGADALYDEAQADCEDTSRQSAISSQAPAGMGAFGLYPQDATDFASDDFILCAIQYPTSTLTQSYVDLPTSQS